MSQRYQDVIEQRQDARQDAQAYDIDAIAREAGVATRTAQAWRAGLVVPGFEADKCAAATRRLHDSKVPTVQATNTAFTDKLDAGFKGRK